MEVDKIVCLLIDSPYLYPLLDHKLAIIPHLISSVEQIVLFFYIDGIHQLNSHQYPKNFTNIGRWYENLHQTFSHVQFYACSRCTAARGYLDLQKSDLESNVFISSKLLPFVEIVSIKKLGELVAEGFRVIKI